MRHLRLPALTFFVGVILASGIVMATAATKPAKTTKVKACATERGALRLRDGRRCEKGTHKVALNLRGRRGAKGAKGASGAAGAAGRTGPMGPAGTPDPSSFYTKEQADGRFAKQGSEIVLPGLAFRPIDSDTGFNYADFAGIYEQGPRQYAGAVLDALPSGATVTSVDFFIKHVTGGQTELDLSRSSAAEGGTTMSAGAIVSKQHTTLSATIQKVTLTPAGGYTPPAGTAVELYWNPANQDANDILYQATVHYTGP